MIYEEFRLIEKAEAHSEPSQTPRTEFFAKLVNGWKSLIILAKSLILGVWLGSENACEKVT